MANHTATTVQQIGEMDPARGRYKMYPTENVHNFIKLDTSTGRIEQVQWSLKTDKEFSVWINTSYLSYYGKIGRFELYPTQNMYQFILLDTTDGRVWHVQWGFKPTERWIKRIY
ncbi:MAG: hypothetical protein K2K79_08045 [Paramuribaculum sp.]|nr:hypothetical protein [Paramuribaculum sp.]